MKVIKWLDEHFEEYLLVFLLMLISCTMMLQIVMRYAFNSSLSWPEEFNRYCFVWSSFLGISYSVKKGIMLRIDAVLNFMSNKVKSIIEILVQLVVLTFFGYLLINSIDVVRKIYVSGQTSPAMGIPMHYIYACTVVGFILTVIRVIQSIAIMIKNILNNDQSKLYGKEGN